MLFVPLQPLPRFSMRIDLDGVTVALRFRWSELSSFWGIDVKVPELGVELLGLALVTGADVLAGHAVPELGALVLIDLQGDDDPGYDEFGDRWRLVYVTRSEIDGV